jgi:hypothetical protein
VSERYSYEQARAIIARTLLGHYTRAEIIERLVRLGDRRPTKLQSARSLAYRVAWRLLPSPGTLTSSEIWEPGSNAVLDRTDGGTVPK